MKKVFCFLSILCINALPLFAALGGEKSPGCGDALLDFAALSLGKAAAERHSDPDASRKDADLARTMAIAGGFANSIEAIGRHAEERRESGDYFRISESSEFRSRENENDKPREWKNFKASDELLYSNLGRAKTDEEVEWILKNTKGVSGSTDKLASSWNFADSLWDYNALEAISKTSASFMLRHYFNLTKDQIEVLSHAPSLMLSYPYKLIAYSTGGVGIGLTLIAHINQSSTLAWIGLTSFPAAIALGITLNRVISMRWSKAIGSETSIQLSAESRRSIQALMTAYKRNENPAP